MMRRFNLKDHPERLDGLNEWLRDNGVNPDRIPVNALFEELDFLGRPMMTIEQFTYGPDGKVIFDPETGTALRHYRMAMIRTPAPEWLDEVTVDAQ